MIKQEFLDIVNNSNLDSHDKETFLSILVNEGEEISNTARTKILHVMKGMLGDIAEKAGITLTESDEIEKIDAKFRGEVEVAEKLLSRLDMSERDLEIAHTSKI